MERTASEAAVVSDDIVQVKRLGSPAELRERLGVLGVELPIADSVDPAGPLSDELRLPGRAGTTGSARAAGDGAAPGDGAAGLRIANRWAILPMEGWDATTDGRPSDLVRRRWRRFGASGAGLIWGGEAVAVVPEGRANPHQLCIGEHSAQDLASLHDELVSAHADAHGTDSADSLVVGLQLTHSGRWSRPEGEPAPLVAHNDPVLDARVGADHTSVVSDAYLEDLVGSFVDAARLAVEAGFDFVDVKQCHGYLGHELLSAHDRPGPYGGDLSGRSAWVISVLDAIGSELPDLVIGSRLSLYDFAPHTAGPDGIGVAVEGAGFCFGGDGTGIGVDLAETHSLVAALARHGAQMLCATASSPYYAPHAQRPAFFPPSDGYRPPGDPLVEVARMQAATREITAAHPEVVVVGSGLSYCQDWLPNVAQQLVADRWMYVVGMGRMALSHPSLPADTLAGRPPTRRLVCRTFSDCTTAPRNGMVSGCYPLDDFYKQRPERGELAEVKRAARRKIAGAPGSSP